VRGDSGYGNECILHELEHRAQPCLLRLRQTANQQRLVAMQFARQDWSRPDNHGCQMVEDWLQLHGWSKKRRVVIVRQRIKDGIARERRVDCKQLKLDLAGPSVLEGERLWEYAVMVTDAKYPVESIGQLYRDRADCRICKVSGFDALKKQWGLSGFTTQDINRCQTMARACALVYNWWSWYCRSANPTARMEAITSRPLLIAAVCRAAHSGGQTTLYLTPMHGKASLHKALIANIRAGWQLSRTGSRGRPAGLRPPPNSPLYSPARSSPLACLAGRACRANFGATATSIAAHGSRVVSTATGCRRSIIASSRGRKKSGVAMHEIPQKSTPRLSITEGSRGSKNRNKPRIHAGCSSFAGPTL